MASIFEAMTHIEESQAVSVEEFQQEIFPEQKPVIMRGLVKDWPLVKTGRDGIDALFATLSSHANEQQTPVYIGDAAMKGRFGYTDDLTGFNFYRQHMTVKSVLALLKENMSEPEPRHIYAGSVHEPNFLPGLFDDNPMPLVPGGVKPYVWIGNNTRVSAHYDIPHNIACVAAGTRRFTLFPTEQIDNLYIGPIDFTPAGQSLSLVDFHGPDFARFPKFHDALAHAQVAELEPGDAIFIPSLWWHHVESPGPIGMLANYWWRDDGAHLTSPMNMVLLGLMSVRELPVQERRAWHALMKHYIFNESGEDPMAHIPDNAKGLFGETTPENARRLRSILLKALNR